MPVRNAPLTFVIPARFAPGWSLLGRLLRRLTGDRLRAEALHITLLTGAALLWLMAVYTSEALAQLLVLEPVVAWSLLGGLGMLAALAGAAGVRPRTVVTCSASAVHIERGRERLRLRYAALASTEPVAARTYHRHYRRYAAVRPFLGTPGRPVLLLCTRGDLVVALGLQEEDRAALRRRIEEAKEPAKQKTPEAVEAIRS